MVAKKGLIFVGIVLGCMPCLFGNDEKIVSNKTNYLPTIPQKVDARISGDIERPLLRPVVYKKEESIPNSKNQKTEELPSGSKREDGVESLLFLLRTEREKLQELENQYNKKSESGTKNTINQRLEMIIKNVSQLDVAECYYKLCEYDNALQMYKLFSPNNTSSDQYIWAQYQVANCYRNMKKYDIALSEYQRFVNQFPESDLTDQAKWYMEDIGWWKAWSEKNTLANNQLLTASKTKYPK